MGKTKVISTVRQYCLGCLNSTEDYNLHDFNVKNENFKAIFQVDKLKLCYICKRMAQHADLFIQNVQSNQILLENFHNIDDTIIQSARSQSQPVMKLTNIAQDIINLDNNSDLIEESISILHSGNQSVKVCEVKVEIKEEDQMSDDLEGEFLSDNEFQDTFVKDEELPLKELFKDELDDIKSNLRKSKHVKLKRKEKIIKELSVRKKEKPRIQIVNITREQCMAERDKMAQDQKYVNSAFKCEDCIKGFNFKMSYEKHMEKHTESYGDFECDICKQRKDTEDKLLYHKRYHEVRYRCSECGLMRVTRMTIKDHYSAQHLHGVYEQKCPHCGKTFNRQVSLRKHIMYLHKKRDRSICGFCGKSYAHKNGLKAHIMQLHSNAVSNIPKYKCEDCGKCFNSPSQLKNHSRRHSVSRDYYCVECDKSFKSDSILKHHLKTASPHVKYIELPLVCSHCNKRFAIRRDLDRHMNRVHLNIKPFRCDKCDKGYVNSWSLKDHNRLVHEGYKRPMRFPCTMCDKVFDRNQILKSHIRTHTGERPYHCSKCPAQFTQAGILGTHVKLIHLKLNRNGRPKGVAVAQSS